MHYSSVFFVVFVFEKLGMKPVRKLCTFIGNISLEMYMIHVMLYKVVLYYIPDIRTSDDYSMMKNGLLYLGIIAVSFILSLLFKKFTDCIIVKMNKVKKSDS